MTRLEANREIIKSLSRAVEAFPAMRLVQLLDSLDVIESGDQFYDESEVSLESLEQSALWKMLSKEAEAEAEAKSKSSSPEQHTSDASSSLSSHPATSCKSDADASEDPQKPEELTEKCPASWWKKQMLSLSLKLRRA